MEKKWDKKQRVVCRERDILWLREEAKHKAVKDERERALGSLEGLVLYSGGIQE